MRRISSTFVGVRSVMAWPLGCTVITSASQGASSWELTGSIDTPSPTIFSANTGSGTCSSGRSGPETGARSISVSVVGNVGSLNGDGQAVESIGDFHDDESFVRRGPTGRSLVELGWCDALQRGAAGRDGACIA